MSLGDFAVLAPNDAEGFAGLATIYREAIEPSEQKAESALRRALLDPNYAFLVLRSDGGSIDAFAILYFPPEQRFWLLEYVAVDGRVRSRGLGEAIFNAACAHAAGRAPGTIGLLEVDQPAATPDTRRRLKFYARMGCRKVRGLGYILPLEVMGTPPPMMLLVQATLATCLPREIVRGWLRIVYRDVYGCRTDDPRIAMMMAGLPEDLELDPLTPVETGN